MLASPYNPPPEHRRPPSPRRKLVSLACYVVATALGGLAIAVGRQDLLLGIATGVAALGFVLVGYGIAD